MRPKTPAQHVAAALGQYEPRVARLAKSALSRLRKHLPGALELVYDNYNALVIAFGPTEKTSEVICSVAVYPRWANLFFMNGRRLPDPARLLKGSGSKIRHVVLEKTTDIDTPEVVSLIEAAREVAVKPLDPKQKRRVVLRAVAAKQRPRRAV